MKKIKLIFRAITRFFFGSRPDIDQDKSLAIAANLTSVAFEELFRAGVRGQPYIALASAIVKIENEIGIRSRGAPPNSPATTSTSSQHDPATNPTPGATGRMPDGGWPLNAKEVSAIAGDTLRRITSLSRMEDGDFPFGPDGKLIDSKILLAYLAQISDAVALAEMRIHMADRMSSEGIDRISTKEIDY